MEKFGAGFGLGFVTGLFGGKAISDNSKDNSSKDNITELPVTVVPFVNGVDGGDTSTTNVPTGTALLFESLKGISVTGDGADLYTVKVLGLARAKEVAMRGTKGVNRDQPTVFVRFADMSNTHLENTLANGRNVSPDERRIIESVLEDRQLADLAAPVDADEFDDTDEV